MFRRYIKWALESAIASFRMPAEDEATALHAALTSYEKSRHGMHHAMRDRRAADYLRIGDVEALSLYRGAAFVVNQLGSTRICVHVYDSSRRGGTDDLPMFSVFADDVVSANERARQLVSALDGARRV